MVVQLAPDVADAAGAAWQSLEWNDPRARTLNTYVASVLENYFEGQLVELPAPLASRLNDYLAIFLHKNREDIVAEAISAWLEAQ